MRSQAVSHKGAIVPGAAAVMSALGCLPPSSLVVQGRQLYNGSLVKSRYPTTAVNQPYLTALVPSSLIGASDHSACMASRWLLLARMVDLGYLRLLSWS